MQALTFEGPGVIRHQRSWGEPTLRSATDAIVRVRLAGLCGSDLHPYLGREPARSGVIAGHEAVGEVVATGAEVTGHAPGDRVVVPFTTSCGRCTPCERGVTARCDVGELFGFGDPDHLERSALDGAQATLLRVPLVDTTAVAAPASLTDEVALLLADNLPTAWEAVTRAELTAGEPLVVVGLGAVGACAVASARAQGADPVFGIDPVASRRTAALELGADATFAPDDAQLPAALSAGAGSIVEATGADGGQRLAFELLRPGGTLSIIAVQTSSTFAFTPAEAYDANVTVRAGRASVRATIGQVLTALTTGSLSPHVGRVVTHAGIPLADGPELYRRFADREPGLVKAAFAPTD